MSERVKDRRGTFWDWPVGLMVGGAVIALVTDLPLFGLLLVVVGVVALLVRRGAFTPRR